MAELSKNALHVLEKRYFLRDVNGNLLEDWQGLCHRVAAFIASKEPDASFWTNTFYDEMFDLRFLPNSPTLFNAGIELGNLSGCYVLPVPDNLSGIFMAVHDAAMVFRSGGGCGYDFSDLRKKGSPVSGTSGVSSGPVSFIQVFNTATDVIKQGGKRRGANMGILRIDHPDIEEFIDAKQTEGTLANFNLSVAVTDGFMEAVEANDKFQLFDRYTGDVDRVVDASQLFNLLVERTWSNGEPGILFIDEINRRHPLNKYKEIKATNPCGEQPLLPNESCNLGSINLVKFYGTLQKWHINWKALKETINIAVRFLDNVIDVNKYPTEELDKNTKASRKIGLGVMGFADLLLRAELPYGSPRARELANDLMEFIEYHAISASVGLARERGAFPLFSEYYTIPDLPESKNDELDWIQLRENIKEIGLRNAAITTIAPTGTLSIIANVSSGIEPNFKWEYIANRVDDQLEYYHPIAESFLSEGESLPGYFQTSSDIGFDQHIEMQAVFQKWIDASISKTINMPTSATKDDVRNAILQAWHSKCKGMTLYREGSRTQEVLVEKKRNATIEEVIVSLEHDDSARALEGIPIQLLPVIRDRPKVTEGKTISIEVGHDCGHIYVTGNRFPDSKKPCEAFVMLGRSGGCLQANMEAIGRLMSILFRAGIPLEDVVKQLARIRCSQTRISSGRFITSCPDAIAYALELIFDLKILSEQDEPASPDDPSPSAEKKNTAAVIALGLRPECPDCHETSLMVKEGRCVTCRSCGWSKCV